MQYLATPNYGKVKQWVQSPRVSNVFFWNVKNVPTPPIHVCRDFARHVVAQGEARASAAKKKAKAVPKGGVRNIASGGGAKPILCRLWKMCNEMDDVLCFHGKPSDYDGTTHKCPNRANFKKWDEKRKAFVNKMGQTSDEVKSQEEKNCGFYASGLGIEAVFMSEHNFGLEGLEVGVWHAIPLFCREMEHGYCNWYIQYDHQLKFEKQKEIDLGCVVAFCAGKVNKCTGVKLDIGKLSDHVILTGLEALRKRRELTRRDWRITRGRAYLAAVGNECLFDVKSPLFPFLEDEQKRIVLRQLDPADRKEYTDEVIQQVEAWKSEDSVLANEYEDRSNEPFGGDQQDDDELLQLIEDEYEEPDFKELTSGGGGAPHSYDSDVEAIFGQGREEVRRAAAVGGGKKNSKTGVKRPLRREDDDDDDEQEQRDSDRDTVILRDLPESQIEDVDYGDDYDNDDDDEVQFARAPNAPKKPKLKRSVSVFPDTPTSPENLAKAFRKSGGHKSAKRRVDLKQQ